MAASIAATIFDRTGFPLLASPHLCIIGVQPGEDRGFFIGR